MKSEIADYATDAITVGKKTVLASGIYDEGVKAIVVTFGSGRECQCPAAEEATWQIYDAKKAGLMSLFIGIVSQNATFCVCP